MSRAKSISVAQLIAAIEQLPSDKAVVDAGVWYTTQKEHWLGWLGQYHSPGAYGRQTTSGRDAKFAYNHIVNSQMLIYLARASGIDRTLVVKAHAATQGLTTMMAQSGAVRRLIPWSMIEAVLWP